MGQPGTFSNSSRDTSQKTRNDIVGVSFIESKLAVPISLLMRSTLVVPVALVFP